MKFIWIAALLGAASVRAQAPAIPPAAAPAAPGQSAQSAQADQPVSDKVRRIIDSLNPGEKFTIERTDAPSLRVGPALGGNTQVIMPAHAIDSLVSTQTKLINELTAKVRELESRVQKLERGAR